MAAIAPLIASERIPQSIASPKVLVVEGWEKTT